MARDLVIRERRMLDGTYREAAFSPCGAYRYWLLIAWACGSAGPLWRVIGLNPSTATECANDPTVAKLERNARRAGGRGLLMLNLFAIRATDPRDMLRANKPIGRANTIELLRDLECSHEWITVAAWGGKGSHLGRAAAVRAAIPDLRAFRISEKTGEPYHPLYLPEPLAMIELSGPSNGRANKEESWT